MTKRESSKTASLHRVGMLHGAEVALLLPLIRSIDFNEEVLSECTDKGFLPLEISNALTVAKFLSRTILAAQAAQRTHGFPSSVLISMALLEWSMSPDALTKHLGPSGKGLGRDCCYSPEIQRWFMKKAAYLANSRKGREAMKLLPGRESAPDLQCLKSYVKKLRLEGILDPLGEMDLVGNIEVYGLDECDLGATLPPNMYTRLGYSTFVNGRGSRKVRPSWIDNLAWLRAETTRTEQPVATAAS